LLSPTKRNQNSLAENFPSLFSCFSPTKLLKKIKKKKKKEEEEKKLSG
jgi:hypothetical protein